MLPCQVKETSRRAEEESRRVELEPPLRLLQRQRVIQRYRRTVKDSVALIEVEQLVTRCWEVNGLNGPCSHRSSLGGCT
jgi:hypothetical protein